MMTRASARPEDHCWPVQPWAAKQLALLRLAAIEPPPHGDEWCPIQEASVGVVSPAQPARSESLTPHVAFRFLARHPELVRDCQNLLSRAPPRAQLHRFEAPSTNKSHRLCRLSPASTAWAATGILTRRQ